MAQLWFGLAQHAEEQDADFLSRTTATRSDKNNGDENGHSSGEDEEGAR
jgi:hypothetical protein